jgi:F-type H+-transporting ATPase subunit b
MNALALFAAEGGQIERIARTFGVDWAHLGAQVISFGIVCALLYKFAYKRILTMLEERRQQIGQGLANEAKIKAELERTEAERQEVMKKAYAESSRLIEDARGAASSLLERETKKATATAEEIAAKAREAAIQDHDRMLTELRGELGHWALEAARIVTGKTLTSEDQRRLAEEAAQQVATEK